MVGCGERLDHRTTKIGGVPDWPQAAAAECEKVGGSDACSSPPPEMTVCAQCGCTMALVTQAHAPLVSGELLNGTAVADRVLYLFTCFSNTCPGANTNAGRWRCLRAQAPLVHTATLANDTFEGETYRPSIVPETEVEGAVVGEVADDWGGGGRDDWGDAGDGSGGADDLANALDALATRDTDDGTAKKHKDQKRDETDTNETTMETTTNNTTSSRSKWLGPRLPEFYLLADYEPDASVASALTSSELADTERLLQKYAQEEGLEVNHGENAAAAIAVAIEKPNGSGNSQNEYAAEAYESGKVDGVDGRYLKFSKRLKRAPEQCVRYAFGGGALVWPVDGVGPEKECAKCEKCGSMRKTEMQLAPPLLHFVSQALEWRDDSNRQSGNDVIDSQVDQWDWQAVAVMTCVSSCGPSVGNSERKYSGGFFWSEEVVATADGDGGLAELLRSGNIDIPERDVVVQQQK